MADHLSALRKATNLAGRASDRGIRAIVSRYRDTPRVRVLVDGELRWVDDTEDLEWVQIDLSGVVVPEFWRDEKRAAARARPATAA